MISIRLLSNFLLVWHLLSITTLANATSDIFPKPLSPRIANYDIDVTLDTKTQKLDGHEILRWYNKTGNIISELQFHLYLNAFRNNKSTFFKESVRRIRSERNHEGYGFIEIESMTLSTGENLTSSMEFIHPDDENEDDKTVVRVLLPKPLSPGDSIVLLIDFVAKLPQPIIARTGAKEEYFFVAQWFPKIGVHINGKWNCHQFHATSEFFADFGVYNVQITVPKKNIVGATGLEVNVKNNKDGTATHFFHAEDVHDFAWTTSPEFIEFNDTIQDVTLRVLMQPDHADQGKRHLEAAKVAIEHFQQWYGDYPFPNLTVVDPRRGAGASSGMEYPTLITAGTTYGLPEGVRLVELIIIHEFGHNFWYHMLASNEFEESWLDEGINTYTETQIMNDRYGPRGDILDFCGIKMNDLQLQRVQYTLNPNLDPTIRKAWKYYSSRSYGINSYAKPALLLTTLQNYLGKEIMQKILHTYVKRWSFKHPTSKDFTAIANEVAGQNLDWFFNQALYSNAILDYSIDNIQSKKIPSGEGYDYSLSIKNDQENNGNNNRTEHLRSISEDDTLEMYFNEVNVRRLGTFKFPVEIEIKFEGGEVIREHWDGQELWKKYRYIKHHRLISATVDPDNKIPLDVNLTNNSQTLNPQRLGTFKLSARFLFWTQFILDQPEFLNLLSIFGGIF